MISPKCKQAENSDQLIENWFQTDICTIFTYYLPLETYQLIESFSAVLSVLFYHIIHVNCSIPSHFGVHAIANNNYNSILYSIFVAIVANCCVVIHIQRCAE